MIPLYTLVLAFVGVIKVLFVQRAGRLEKKFVNAALDAEKAAKVSCAKPGNNVTDALATAKRQYELGRLVQNRDALEQKYHTWQARADGATRLFAKLAGLKGRLVPYFAGFVDVALILIGLDALGLPHGLNAVSVKDWAQAWRQ